MRLVLANWFCSEEEIAQIKEENSVKDTTEVTDTSLITIDTTKNEDVPDIQIIDVKGSTYRGKLMIVKDPSRLIIWNRCSISRARAGRC